MMRVRRRKLLTILLTAVALIATQLAFVSTAAATDLRGRVESRNAYTGSTFVRQGAVITLLAWNGAQWIPLRQVVSGPDGMYYFPQVAPGPYLLNVNGMTFNLQVSAVPYQDIPPVLAP